MMIIPKCRFTNERSSKVLVATLLACLTLSVVWATPQSDSSQGQADKQQKVAALKESIAKN